MVVRTLLLAASFAAATAPSEASVRPDGPDMTKLFGRDNAEYARQIFRLGYWDLAEKFCTDFEAWPSGEAAEKAAVRSVYLDLRLEIARDEQNPQKRREAVEQLLKEKEEFIKTYAGTAEASEAEYSLPDAYRMLGEAITDALKKESDGATAVQMRQAGSDAFAHAEQVLRTRRSKIEASLADTEISESASLDLSDQRSIVWYNIARTTFFRAQLFPQGDPARVKFLKDALRSLQDFALEYDDKLVNYEGLIIQGLCDKELGDTKQALIDFDDVIALRDGFEEQGDPVPQDVEDVISSAVRQKMLFLSEGGNKAEAIDCAKEFFAKSKQPQKAQFGLALLAEQANLELEGGDTAAAQATAAKLEQLDPSGPWGNRGREILGKMVGGQGGMGGGSFGAAQLLKIAESLARDRDLEGAIRICASTLDAARGDAAAADTCVAALLIMSACYRGLDDYLASAVVLDEAVRRFPKASRTDEALYQSIQSYLKLNGTDKRAYYRKAVEERRLRIANEFSKSPYAASIQLLTGQQLMEEGKFLEAADYFLKIAAESQSYADAQYLGGRCLVLESQRLSKAKQAELLKAMVARADAQLKQAKGVNESVGDKTLDLKQKATCDAQAFECRTLLATLYMLEGVGRQGDVLKVLEDVESRYGNDLERVGAAWGLRIQALNSLGKLADAEKLLESLLLRTPDAKSSAKAAGIFARSCDARAVELFGKDPKSAEGDEFWKKSYRFYVMSMKSRLNDPAAGRSGEIEQLANRYFVMGKHFNGVPDGVQSMLAWNGKVAAPDYWQSAAEYYEASLTFVPSYLTSINLARTLGFLGRFRDAAAVYSKLFETTPLVNAENGEVDKKLAASKPALMGAYLELGVCEYRVTEGGDDSDKADRSARALGVFEAVLKAEKSGRELTERWWQAKYWQLRTLVDRGEYKKADLLVRDLERNTNDDDSAKYGLREPLKKLKDEVKKKVFDESGSGSR